MMPSPSTAQPLRAVDHVAEEAPALVHVPALGHQPRAVGEGVFDDVVVEELVGLRCGPAGRPGPGPRPARRP